MHKDVTGILPTESTFIYGTLPAQVGSIVLVGEFDGMHRGHARLVEAGQRVARRLRADLGAVVLDTQAPGRVLMQPTERAWRLLSAGASWCRVLDVSEVRGEATSLVAEIVSTCRPRVVIMSCQGPASSLPDLAGEFRRRGVEMIEVDRQHYLGEPIHSERVRRLVETGDVAMGSELLGRSFSLSGEVTTGRQLGRTIGFPTANIAPPDRHLCPRTGVYAATVRLDDQRRCDAAVNIGVRPTVERSGQVLIEAHLLDFDEDLYGRTIDVELLDHIRDERKFDGLDALVEQLHRDVAAVRSIGRRLLLRRDLASSLHSATDEVGPGDAA